MKRDEKADRILQDEKGRREAVFEAIRTLQGAGIEVRVASLFEGGEQVVCLVLAHVRPEVLHEA